MRTPSFRFWARKRFVLKTRGDQLVLCAKDDEEDVGNPVCIKENLYSVLTKAHMECDHRGRDPTYDVVSNSLTNGKLKFTHTYSFGLRILGEEILFLCS